MTDLVKRLRSLSDEARDDFANDRFDAEETGERPDLMQITVEVPVELFEAAADRIEELEAEVARLVRDAKVFAAKLAIKGGNESYPTLWAYEQACAALDKHRARAEAAEAKLATARNDALDEAAAVAWSDAEDSDWNFWSDDGYTAAAEVVSREIHAAIRALKSTSQT